MTMNGKDSPRFVVKHICRSHQPTLRQKLQKSMSLPTLQTERKIKYENTTTAIRNAGFSAKLKVNEL